MEKDMNEIFIDDIKQRIREKKEILQMAKLTILVPIYNEVKYVKESLESIQRQTFEDFICIIGDNYSDDGSYEICENFSKQDRRFICYKHPSNIGLQRNARFLFQKAETEFVMTFSGHDIIEKSFLEKMIDALNTNSKIALAFSRVKEIDENGIDIRSLTNTKYDFQEDAINRYMQSIEEIDDCLICNGVLRKDLIADFEFYDDIPAPDLIFICHLMWYGRLLQCDEILYKRRIFKFRDSHYMERITGKKDSIIDNRKLLKAFLNDFNKLYRENESLRYFYNDRLTKIFKRRYPIDLIRNNLILQRIKNFMRLKFPRFFYLIKKIKYIYCRHVSLF